MATSKVIDIIKDEIVKKDNIILTALATRYATMKEDGCNTSDTEFYELWIVFSAIHLDVAFGDDDLEYTQKDKYNPDQLEWYLTHYAVAYVDNENSNFIKAMKLYAEYNEEAATFLNEITNKANTNTMKEVKYKLDSIEAIHDYIYSCGLESKGTIDESMIHFSVKFFSIEAFESMANQLNMDFMAGRLENIMKLEFDKYADVRYAEIRIFKN